MHSSQPALAAPALPARSCCQVVFLEWIPLLLEQRVRGLQGGEERAGHGVGSHLGHDGADPIRL